MNQANIIELEKVSRPVFGISPRRYREMANEGLLPPVRKGKIEFVLASKALIAYYRKVSESHGSLTLTDERAALTAIKKEREKLKLEKDQGSLVPKGEAIKWVSLLVAEAKAAFMNFPRRMGPLLAPVCDEKECEQILRGEIWAILRHLSEERKKKAKANEKI